MIELKNDSLVFSFPEVHPRARAEVGFQRTLRIPDDHKTYGLPPGLGQFPLRHVDDFAERLSDAWRLRGGVMLPMYQSEALWLNFGSTVLWGQLDDHDGEWVFAPYPFALKVAAGKIDAVTGKSWSDGLSERHQDYLVLPGQPWLDGFCVSEGVIRQFVAMPLGAGYSAEEQITGTAEHGGLQLIAYPMKADVYERRFPPRKRERFMGMVNEDAISYMALRSPTPVSDMGLSPGGRMHQKIYPDEFDFSDWDQERSSRCFVHIANSMVWRSITREDPPTTPPTAAEYSRAGLPWFDLYDEGEPALGGGGPLAGLKSVFQMGQEKGEVPLPENTSVEGERVVQLRRESRDQVREGSF